MKPLPAGLGAGCDHCVRGVIVCVAQPGTDRPQLRPPETFAQIADQKERSLALFDEAAEVITHPRCLNCHPAGDRPTQGMDTHPHLPLVVRGADGHGAIGMRCELPRSQITTRTPTWDMSSGIWLRSRWRGRAKRLARSASRSRIRSGTAEKASTSSFITWRRISSLDGAGTLVLVESCARHTEGVWRSSKSMGGERSSLPEPIGKLHNMLGDVGQLSSCSLQSPRTREACRAWARPTVSAPTSLRHLPEKTKPPHSKPHAAKVHAETATKCPLLKRTRRNSLSPDKSTQSAQSGTYPRARQSQTTLRGTPGRPRGLSKAVRSHFPAEAAAS